MTKNYDRPFGLFYLCIRKVICKTKGGWPENDYFCSENTGYSTETSPESRYFSTIMAPVSATRS
jgi:hypothetical protein